MNAPEPVSLNGERGKLKIFFGCSDGVGKTSAMLSAGRQMFVDGTDVVVGAIEETEREDIRTLIKDIPAIPLVEYAHENTVYREFDLDITLLRKPHIVLLDELAHANAPGARHPRRWNDVEELLTAGIHVHATLNVQDIESMRDTVAGITGVRPKHTVPDSVFDAADDIILVDINADELLRRMRSGKITVPSRDRNRAYDSFLKGNIIALRDLALRRTLARVDAQMELYNISAGIRKILPVADKVMVCIGPEQLSEKLIRTARRMSDSLRAQWIAVYVENARHYRLSDAGKAAVEAHQRMAESLGGKTLVLQGTNAVDEIVDYARSHGVTKIIIGKKERTRWRDAIFGSLADNIINKSGHIDVYVVTGHAGREDHTKPISDLYEFKPVLYVQSLLLVALCSALGIMLSAYLKNEDQMAIYLLGNVVASASLGRGPSIMYALLAAACFNFFFVEPMAAINIYDRSFWMTSIVMLVTSIVINSYAARLRLQARFARKREHDARMLYAFTREIAATRGHQAMCKVAASHIKEAVNAETVIGLPDKTGHIEVVWGELPQRDIIRESGLMRWCYDNMRSAGIGTDTMPSAATLYVPLKTAEGRLGVLGVMPRGEDRHLSPEQVSLIEAFANLLSTGIERANASESAIHDLKRQIGATVSI